MEIKTKVDRRREGERMGEREGKEWERRGKRREERWEGIWEEVGKENVIPGIRDNFNYKYFSRYFRSAVFLENIRTLSTFIFFSFDLCQSF